VLLEDGIVNAAAVTEIDEAAKQEAQNAADFALKAPWPTEDTITEDVYWTADHPGEHDNQGKLFFNEDRPTKDN
jgi:pyruvate dehydrogenase E1 component alpha subunit